MDDYVNVYNWPYRMLSITLSLISVQNVFASLIAQYI